MKNANSFIVYYDMETGLFYTKEEFAKRFSDLKDWEITMRFMPCVRYKAREN